MTESEISPSISQIQVPNDEENSSNNNCRETCLNIGNHILLIIYRLLSDCLICRLLAFIFTLQAAIIWLGFALNFILQLLFLPFGQSRFQTVIGSYLMVPGTVAFSAHYFWYIIQTACHAFRRDLVQSNQTIPSENKSNISDFLLLFINSNMIAKRIYRLFVTILTISYMIYYLMGDSWSMLIVPAGEVPLILMWLLNITHIIGLFCFVIFSFSDFMRNKFILLKPDVIQRGHLNNGTISSNQTWKLIISIILIQIIIPIAFQLLAILHKIIWFALFIFWLILFGRTWPPEKDQCVFMCLCCCVNSNESNHSSEKQSKRLITYKLFILFILSAMITSLAFVICSRTDLNQSERIIIICVLCFAGIFEILLLMPPYLGLNFIKIQIFVINILMLAASILVLIGVSILFLNPNANKWIVIVCLVPLLIHLFLIFIYYLYHIIYDGIHHNRKYISGLSVWIESHNDISIFRNAFYFIFAIMIIIGFTGLALCSSVFFQDEIQSDNQTLYGDMLIEYNQGIRKNLNITEKMIEVENKMEACNWQFHSLTIQDMVLLAALAYRPTAKVKIELEKFFGSSKDLQFQLDENFSNYKEYGYGDVTYFTVTTADMVIVSIRGTKLLYEWLIDFDTWTESFIYQIISMLFPWSKLFPENLTSKIIHHMASLKRLTHRTDDPRRFYVIQMIRILEKIYQKYKEKKSFIVVGHSLGGGLAKLSGIALNFTDVLISISGPGITHAHATVDQTKDVPMERINRRIFNIYHDRDLVPWTDKQEGLIQIVTCPSEFKRLQCHYVTPLFCHVVRICGNPRGFKNVPVQSSPDLVQAENEFEMVEVELEQHTNNLEELLKQTREENATLKTILLREVNATVLSLINQIVNTIILEADLSKETNIQYIEEPKI